MDHAAQPKPFSALAITALVFAIIATLLSWVPIVNNIAFIVAIIGLVFAGFAMHATRKSGQRRGKALAVAALVVSLVAGGLVLGTQSIYGKAVDDAFGSSETTATSKPKKSKAKTENSNMFDVNVTAFQNGHQLDTAIYSDQTPEGYDENSSTNALQPGATGTVTLGYVLEDETNPVTVEVSGTLDMSGQKVTHEFALQ